MTTRTVKITEGVHDWIVERAEEGPDAKYLTVSRSAFEALKVIQNEDLDYVAETGNSRATVIEWYPKSRIGRRIVNTLRVMSGKGK